MLTARPIDRVCSLRFRVVTYIAVIVLPAPRALVPTSRASRARAASSGFNETALASRPSGWAFFPGGSLHHRASSDRARLVGARQHHPRRPERALLRLSEGGAEAGAGFSHRSALGLTGPLSSHVITHPGDVLPVPDPLPTLAKGWRAIGGLLTMVGAFSRHLPAGARSPRVLGFSGIDYVVGTKP